MNRKINQINILKGKIIKFIICNKNLFLKFSKKSLLRNKVYYLLLLDFHIGEPRKEL